MAESTGRRPELGADLAAVHDFAVAVASAPSEADGFSLVAQELRAVTGALVVGVSSYDSSAAELVVKYVAPSGRMLTSLNRLLGREIVGMRMPVPAQMREQMLSSVVAPALDVSTLSFGVIPDPVSALIHEVLRLGAIKGLLLNYGEEIIGTAVIVMRHGQPPPSDEVLHVLARVAAVTLRRKRAEEALRESEQRFALFMRHCPSLVFIRDAEGHTLFANPPFEDLAGVQANDLRTKTLDDIWPPVEAAQMRRADELALTTGKAAEIIEEHRGRQFLTSRFRILRRDGAPLLGGFATDVTETGHLEQKRHALETRVLEAQRFESLGVLACGIAQDFNSLLTSILANAGLALTQVPPDSPAHQSVALIEEAARHSAGLSRQLLAYTGRGKFVVKAVDLSELVREMAPGLELTAASGCTLRYSLAAGLPAVEGDVAQLRRLVMNLIVNASEAIGGRSGLVTLRTELMDRAEAPVPASPLHEALPPGRYVCLEVSDTGCGMSPEDQARIFDPPFTTRFMGRGLGLAAVHGIVRSHGGAIELRSEIGRGTTFRILLPASQRPAGIE